MSPHDLERSVVAGQMPLPHQSATHVERDQLTRGKPGEHPLAVRGGARARHVVLLVRLRQIALGLDLILPGEGAVGAVERADEEHNPFTGTVYPLTAEGAFSGRVGRRRGSRCRRMPPGPEWPPTEL